MKKHYASPEVEAFLLSAVESVATQGGISLINDDNIDGDATVESSIFG